MKKRTLFGLLAAVISSVAIAGSTINPNVPSANSTLSSAPIRANAQAAYNDINNILSMYASPTAPSSPTIGQFWRDTSAAPQAVKQYDGTSWVTWGTLNITTHVWTPIAASGSLVATAPITVGFGGGIGTFGLAVDSNFATISSQLGFSNINAGNVLGNSTSNPAEPTSTTLTAMFDRAFGTTQGNTISRGAGTWGTGNQLSTLSADLGTPTGGNEGTGTINAGVAYYLNGQVLEFSGQPCGRLTTVSATPIMTATFATAPTVFYTPYLCDRVPIYDGTNWIARSFTELSNINNQSSTGSAGPAAMAANKNYDYFIWSNAGVLTLTRGALWNSDTVRSATTENDLERVNGVWMNKNAITNGPGVDRGVYVGTVRSNGTSSVTWTLGASGTAANLTIWNMYNRVPMVSTQSDNNATYGPYTSATIRQANASAVNQVNFISGLAEDNPTASVNQSVSMGVSATATMTTGLQIDATTTFAKSSKVGGIAAAALIHAMGLNMEFSPQLGYHFISQNEQADGTTGGTLQGQTLDAFTFQLRM